MKFIKTYKSPNYNLRAKNSQIKYIILHYTAILKDKEALEHLCDASNKVSCHFLLSKSGDIFELVDVRYRAWHAGHSYWKRTLDVNSNSIGIELCNSGHLNNFENYNKNQIYSLIKLLVYLKNKYFINSENILGHSDIAPYRKIDPGEKFPWLSLSKKNIVYFPKVLSIKRSNLLEDKLKLISEKSKKNRVLFMLSKIGYLTKPSINKRKQFSILIKAYQMHYLSASVTGILDAKTYEVIKSHYNQLLTT